MNPVQQAFTECHGLQCGFCTPGFLTTVTAFLDENPSPTGEEAREAVSGNLCRCTGYQNIVKSVLRAAELREKPNGRMPLSRLSGIRPVRLLLRRTQRDDADVRGAHQAREDPRLVTGGGRYLDDLGHDALEAPRSFAARTPMRGSSTSTSPMPSMSRASRGSTATRTSRVRWPSRCPSSSRTRR